MWHWFCAMETFFLRQYASIAKQKSIFVFFHLGDSFLKPNECKPNLYKLQSPKEQDFPSLNSILRISVSALVEAGLLLWHPFILYWPTTTPSFPYSLEQKLTFVSSPVVVSWLHIPTRNLAETLLASALHKISILEHSQIKETIINCELSVGGLSGCWLITPLIVAKAVS